MQIVCRFIDVSSIRGCCSSRRTGYAQMKNTDDNRFCHGSVYRVRLSVRDHFRRLNAKHPLHNL